jgi:hypothetical protein
MDKVYFNKDFYGSWWLKSIEYFYSFDCVDITTNEISNHILSWTRNIDVSVYDEEVVRVYDIEVNKEKYYFLAISKDDAFILKAKNPLELERLVNNNNLILVGTTLD